MIAEKRVPVIERIMELKDDSASLEQALQDSIEQAPWLINPLHVATRMTLAVESGARGMSLPD